jgi:hypothetical protein
MASIPIPKRRRIHWEQIAVTRGFRRPLDQIYLLVRFATRDPRDKQKVGGEYGALGIIYCLKNYTEFDS